MTTQIRLKDGETNILAGLIREDERVEKQTLPGLGKVPVLGNIFFAKTHKEAQQTDVVVMLTPHIIRVLDITADDLRPLRMPREGSGAALIEGAPIVPPPPSFEAAEARRAGGVRPPNARACPEGPAYARRCDRRVTP